MNRQGRWGFLNMLMNFMQLSPQVTVPPSPLLLAMNSSHLPISTSSPVVTQWDGAALISQEKINGKEKSLFQASSTNWASQFWITPRPLGHQGWPRKELTLKPRVKPAEQVPSCSYCNTNYKTVSNNHCNPKPCPQKIILSLWSSIPLVKSSPGRLDTSPRAGLFLSCRSHLLQSPWTSRLQAELGLRLLSALSLELGQLTREFKTHKAIKRKPWRASMTPWERDSQEKGQSPIFQSLLQELLMPTALKIT